MKCGLLIFHELHNHKHSTLEILFQPSLLHITKYANSHLMLLLVWQHFECIKYFD